MKRVITIILLMIGLISLSVSAQVLSQEESTAPDCPGSPPSRLAPGMTAYVVIPPEGQPRRDLRVRVEPGGEQVGSISAGQYFVITGEAVCGEDDLLWWPIETRDSSLSGWSVEGFAPDDYMMIPENLDESVAQPTSIPDVETTTAEDDPCSVSPPTRLAYGMLAYAAMPAEGESSRAIRVRAEPGGEQLASLPAGTIFRITGESVCDSEGLRWWPILTIDESVRGWSAEALSAENYLITPIGLRNREIITSRNAISLMVMDKVGLGLSQ